MIQAPDKEGNGTIGSKSPPNKEAQSDTCALDEVLQADLPCKEGNAQTGSSCAPNNSDILPKSIAGAIKILSSSLPRSQNVREEYLVTSCRVSWKVREGGKQKVLIFKGLSQSN